MTNTENGEITKPGDVYAEGILTFGGWWFGTDSKPVNSGRKMWPVHCYGMVGVGRDMPPNTGTGAELYTVIGHAPRHLDRNIALVGRDEHQPRAGQLCRAMGRCERRGQSESEAAS